MLTITNEDNMVLMARYPDKYFELAIVDPPYGIGFSKYKRTHKNNAGKRYKSNKYEVKDWDSTVPSNAYFEELFRVSKNQVIFGGNYFEYLTGGPTPNMKTFQSFQDYVSGSKHKWLIWKKNNPVPNFADCELAWISFPDNHLFDFTYYGNLQGNTKADKKIHPTQKPIQLYRFVLNTFGTKGAKILDTHLGGGANSISGHRLWFQFNSLRIRSRLFCKDIALDQRLSNSNKSF